MPDTILRRECIVINYAVGLKCAVVKTLAGRYFYARGGYPRAKFYGEVQYEGLEKAN